jgi:hypothetical protein
MPQAGRRRQALSDVMNLLKKAGAWCADHADA